jgi:hypothetical protein
VPKWGRSGDPLRTYSIKKRKYKEETERQYHIGNKKKKNIKKMKSVEKRRCMVIECFECATEALLSEKKKKRNTFGNLSSTQRSMN